MAQRALPSGTTRRRTAFGLLDADGWPAAFWKALFWFGAVLFLLGYVPNIALYLTIRQTVQIGYNVISVVNLCDASNGDLPCPVPAGAVVPWQSSPPEVALPEGRADAGAFQGGLDLYLVGGTTPTGVTASVLKTTTTEDGNFGKWSAGPDLPAPRTDAAFVSVNGRPVRHRRPGCRRQADLDRLRGHAQGGCDHRLARGHGAGAEGAHQRCHGGGRRERRLADGWPDGGWPLGVHLARADRAQFRPSRPADVGRAS